MLVSSHFNWACPAEPLKGTDAMAKRGKTRAAKQRQSAQSELWMEKCGGLKWEIPNKPIRYPQ